MPHGSTAHKRYGSLVADVCSSVHSRKGAEQSTSAPPVRAGSRASGRTHQAAHAPPTGTHGALGGDTRLRTSQKDPTVYP